MGTSYVTFDGRSGAFKDSDLLVVLGLAANSMRKQDVLLDLADAWEEAIKRHGPGVADVPMDGLSESSGVRGQLLALLLRLEAELHSHGDSVAIAFLRERCDIPGIRFDTAYPTRLLVNTVQRLRELLEDPAGTLDRSVEGP